MAEPRLTRAEVEALSNTAKAFPGFPATIGADTVASLCANLLAAMDAIPALRGVVNNCPEYVRCEELHHKKGERHESGEVCIPEIRYRDAIVAAREAVSRVRKEPSDG